MKRILTLSVAATFAAAVIVAILFDVDFTPRFELPHTREEDDPAQEARYATCVEDADVRIHGETFAAVDNPDVQRELLYRRMQAAKADCRSAFPRQTITTDVPLDANLIDLEWRY